MHGLSISESPSVEFFRSKDWKLELGKQDCWLRDVQSRIQRMISERKKKSLSSVSARRYAKLDWFHSRKDFF
jgi:hypothetical protein